MSPRSPLHLLRAAVPALALLAAARAGAQTATIALDISQKSAVSVSKADCNVTLTVNWSIAVTGVTSCSDLTVWVTKASTCANAPTTDDQTLGTVTGSTWVSTGSGSFSLPVSGLPVFNGATCPVLNIEQDMRVCAYAQYSALTTGCSPGVEAKASAPPTITYDSKPPDVPTITNVVAMDGALKIEFSAPTDASLVGVYYRSDPLAAYTRGPTGAAGNGSIQVDGLTNGTVYEVIIYAEDAAGNQSGNSAAAYGTPVQSFGFFATYQNEGGGAPTGCAAVPAGALPLLALGWLARRRRRAQDLGGGRS